MSGSVLRLWPLPLALAGIAMLGYSAWRMTEMPEGFDDGGDDIVEEIPDADVLEGPEYFHEVQAHELDIHVSFAGRVEGRGTLEIRAPQGMRVPIVKIHREVGQYVEKGDPLITLFEEPIHKAIKQAEEEGRIDDKKRFEGYLEHVVIRAPVDGQVFDIKRVEGEVPIDVGIPLMLLIRRDAFSFVSVVPEELTAISAQLGTKVSVELEDVGVVQGVVNTHGAADVALGLQKDEEDEDEEVAIVVEHERPDGQIALVIGLDAVEGLEPQMPGQLRLKTGTQEVALVPKAAVELIEDVHLVRVWDPIDAMVVDRTVKLEGTEGDFYIVVAGVHPGEHVVVPGTPPEE